MPPSMSFGPSPRTASSTDWPVVPRRSTVADSFLRDGSEAARKTVDELIKATPDPPRRPSVSFTASQPDVPTQEARPPEARRPSTAAFTNPPPSQPTSMRRKSLDGSFARPQLKQPEWAGAESFGRLCASIDADDARREAALSRARATEAELEAERRREEAAAARAAFDELAVLKHQEITELRADYFAEKELAAARGAELEATTAELKNTRVVLEDTRKEAAARVREAAAAVGALDGVKEEARSLRQQVRTLRETAKQSERADAMIVGATVHEVVSFTGAAGGGGGSLFAKRSKLVPRGLQLSRDRRKLVVADTPDMTSLVFDRTLKMEEVERVTLGVGDSLYATWERLKKPPPRWCCATIVAAGASLHFVFADEAFALAWVLGLQRLAPEKAPRDVEGVLMWRKARWRLQERAAAEQRSVRDVVMQALREAAPEAAPAAAEEVPAEAAAVAAALSSDS